MIRIIFFTLVLSTGAFAANHQDQLKTRLFRKTLEILDALSTKDYERAMKPFQKGFPRKALKNSLEGTFNYLVQRYGEYEETTSLTVRRTITYGYSVLGKMRFGKHFRGVEMEYDSRERVIRFSFPELKNIPEAPAPVAPYVKEDLFTKTVLKLGHSSAPLKALLFEPIGIKDPPVVVFAHDFGAHGPFHRTGVNAFFSHLAKGLASNGIASLVFPKRSHIYKPAEGQELTPKWEVLKDLFASIYTIRNHRNTSHSKVFFLGYGFSSYFSPYLSHMKLFDGFLLLNPSFRPPQDILFEIEEFQTSSDPEKFENLKALAKKLELLHRQKLKPSESLFGYPASYFYDLNRYSPKKYIPSSGTPFLVLFAQKDYVNNPSDEPLIREVLHKAEWQIEKFPDLNRIFHVGKRLEPEVDFHTPGVVSAKVIQILRDWVLSESFNP